MKETKTKSKKRLIYYLVLAISVLLLIAATVLTVYFVTEDSKPVLDNPPVNPGPDDPGEPEDPSEPSGGQTADFVSPVASVDYSMEYASYFKNTTLNWSYQHMAIDFAAEAGDAVYAMAAGTVVKKLVHKATGNYVEIDHGNGITAKYRFLEIDPAIRVGSSVKQGQQIGTVAEAYGIEKDEGTHLHLEMKKNKKYVNPLEYIDVVFDEK